MSTTCHLHIKSNHLPYIITGSLLFLLSSVFVLNFLQIFQIDSANAESKDVGTNVNLEETLPLPSVSPSSVALTLEPNAAGDFDSAAVTVGVSTNHVSGYTLTMNTVGTSTDLSHDSSSDYKIEALSSKTSATDFANLSSTASINKWGFATDNNGSGTGQTDAGYYYPVTNSENPTTIKVTTGPANVSDTQVTFATKGKDLAAGTYSNTVIFTTIANEVPPAIPEYLQDMDTTSCAALDIYDPTSEETRTATTYTIKDKRDNQEYKIRRLYMNTKSSSSTACWMVENLRLTGAKTLTPADSNVSSDFTLKASDTGTWCTTHSSSCDDQSMMIDAHTSTYPESYLYNWYAATAGTGTYNTSSGTVAASICPGKGANTTTWHLPSGNTNGEWYYLFNAYKDDYSWSNISGGSNTTTNNLSTTIGPNFVYSGARGGSSTDDQGSYGGWWSRTALNNNNAYNANLNSTGYVNGGTYHNSKYYGYSVRCVLPAE